MAEIRNPPPPPGRESGDMLVMTLTEGHLNGSKALVLKPGEQAEKYIVRKLREEDKAAINGESRWVRLTLRDFQDGSLHEMELSKHGNDILGGVATEYVLDDWYPFVQARNSNPSNYPLRPGMQVAFCVRDGILHFSARPQS